MPWWPGWDSIEWTSFWNTFYFWFGIICLFLLGGSEIISHYYGERNSFLVAQADTRRAEQQQKENTRRDQEAESLREQLAAAKRAAADRRLSDEQKREILAAISPYPGQETNVTAVMNDGEALTYANDFLNIFNKAKWKVNGIDQSVFNGPVVGVVVMISKEHGERHTVPIGVAHLVMILTKLGIIKEGFADASVSGNAVRVIIGRKPPAF